MRIHPPTVTTGNSGTARLAARIETAAGTRDLWFEVPCAHGEHLVPHRLDAFLIALLLPAMQDGEAIELLGPVSERLMFQFAEQLVPLLLANQPGLRPIAITAAALDGARLASARGDVATGFSGGIDSFLTYYDRNVVGETPGYRIGRFVFNNVGSHGPDLERAAVLFRQRLTHVRKFADEVGIEVIPIDSNLASFYRGPFTASHTMRNVAAVATLQGFLGAYLYSSGYGNSLREIVATTDLAALDPMVLPMLSTEDLSCISSGAQYVRLEKVARLVGYEPTYRHLNVCVSPEGTGGNCSACWKCMQQMLTFEVLDCQESYAPVFDFASYRSRRDAYILSQRRSAKNLKFRAITEHAAALGRPIQVSAGARARDIARRLLKRV